MSGKFLRKFGISLLLLLSVCFSLSAFPSRAKRIDVPAAPTVTATEQEATDVEKERLNGGIGSMILSESDIAADDMGKDEVLALYQAEYHDHMEAEDEIIRLADRVDELEELNAIQADTIARETGHKAYTRITASVGFEEGFSNPSFWLGGALGARIGKGFLFDIGAEYKLGTLTDPTPEIGVENMRFSTSLGWEW